VDILLPEADFEKFLEDDIPPETLRKLESRFENSDSAMHSIKHRQTGIYVDFLSVQSQPVRKKLIRYILEHSQETTHLLRVSDAEKESKIEIIQPEFLIAMKLNRYHKNPKTEKGLSDRLDIIKILKTFHNHCLSLDFAKIKASATQGEYKQFEAIAAGVEYEMTCELDHP
jgi:hypothetical protein